METIEFSTRDPLLLVAHMEAITTSPLGILVRWNRDNTGVYHIKVTGVQAGNFYHFGRIVEEKYLSLQLKKETE